MPDIDNGFIQIATGDEQNDVLTALIHADLNGTEYQCALLVIRKTWGYKKKEDWISLSQFEKQTNKTRVSVCSSIKSLVKKNILVKKTIPGIRAIYGLNKNFLEWRQLVKKTLPVKKTLQTSKENFTPLVKKTLPTKETITKEKIQKKEAFQFLKEFNLIRQTTFSSVQPFLKNFEYWLTQYTLDQIIQAVRNAKLDPFYDEAITPVFLFRTRNKNGECDYIGDLLNKKTEFEKTTQEVEVL